MKLGWKDFYIIITLYIIGILAMFTIIDLTIEKEGTVGVTNALSFIGAILGGTISGVITLLGVRLTIREQRRMMLQGKIDKANFIYRKMVRFRSSLDFKIEYYNPVDVYDVIKSLLKIIDEHSEMLKETELEFVLGIESIRNELESMKESLDDVGGPSSEFAKQLLDMLVRRNSFIQSIFFSLEDNYFSKYK